MDATTVMPRAEFDAAVQAASGCGSPHRCRAVAADAFRARLMDHLLRHPPLSQPPTACLAYVDADILHLRPLPEPCGAALFTIHPSKSSGQMAGQRAECADMAPSATAAARGQDPFQVHPFDHFTNALWVLRRDHPLAGRFAAGIAAASRGWRRYNQGMHDANAVRQSLGLREALPRGMVHPLPWFSVGRCFKPGSAAGFTTYGTATPSADQILARAVAVHLYGSQPAWAGCEWDALPANSLVGRLVRQLASPVELGAFSC